MATKNVNLRVGLLSKQFERDLQRLSFKWRRFGEDLEEVGFRLSAGLTAPIGLLTRELFDNAKSLDNVQKQLRAFNVEIAKTAEELDILTSKQLDELKELSFLPGLTFETAVEGQARLRGIGLAAEEANKVLLEFSNITTLFGGSNDDLQGILRALTQIGSKTAIQAEEINQIAERLPGIREILVDAFGTSFGEDLTKQFGNNVDFIRALTNALGEQPRALRTLESSWRTLVDAINVTLGTIGISIGESLNLNLVFESLAKRVYALADAWTALSEDTRETILQVGLIAAGIGPLILVVGGAITAISTLGGAFVALLSVITPAVALIAAVGVALYGLSQGGVEVSTAFAAVINTGEILLKTLLVPIALALDVLIEGFKFLGLAITEGWSVAVEELVESEKLTTKALTSLGSTVDNIANGVSTGEKVVDFFGTLTDGLGSLTDALSGADAFDLDAIRDKFSKPLELSGINERQITETQKAIEAQKKSFEALRGLQIGNVPSLPLGLFDGFDITSLPLNEIEKLVELLDKGSVSLREFVGEQQGFSSALADQSGQLGIVSEDLRTIVDVNANWQEAMANTRARSEELTDALNDLNLTTSATGDIIVDWQAAVSDALGILAGELSQGADNFADYARNAVDAILDVVAALVKQAVIGAVSSLFTTLPLPLALPLATGAGALVSGLLRTLLNQIPQFATGGIVTGPTLGLVGEAGPEAIIPLPKLAQMQSAGFPDRITLVARGTDLVTVLKRLENDNYRVV